MRETPDLPIVSLEKSGKLYLNGQETTLTKLGAQLGPLLKVSGGVVGLRADEQGNYGGVVQVMDVIKKRAASAWRWARAAGENKAMSAGFVRLNEGKA